MEMIDALYKPLANGKDDGIIRSLFVEAEICVYSDYLLSDKRESTAHY